MVSLETRRAQLEARLAELRSRLHRIEDELEQPVSERFAEQAVEREDEEVLEDLGAAGVQEVRIGGQPGGGRQIQAQDAHAGSASSSWAKAASARAACRQAATAGRLSGMASHWATAS